MINRRAVLSAATVSLAGCAGIAHAPPTLEEIIANHTRARGGAATLDAIRNTRNVATIVEPSFTVRGRYIASVDGRMRIDVFQDGANVFSEGLDAEGAWQREGADAPLTPVSDAGRAALLHGVEFNLFGLHALSARGHRISLDGREIIGGANFHVLKIVLSDGFETYRYIDPESSLMTRKRDVRALHPDVDPATRLLETVESDFRPVNGVLSAFAWEQRDVAHNAVVQNGVIHSLEYNAEIADEIFLRATPAAAL